jgi:parvulin-like peptidyl-prolyl isomerase
MTFRAKPVNKRPRNQWESQDRRNFLTNLAFGFVIVAAVAILGIAFGLTWYNDHLAPVGHVDGQAITKDELRERQKIEEWRLAEQIRRMSTQISSGRLSAEQAERRQQLISSQQQQIAQIALERIIDNRIQARLAVEEGISVADADIDTELADEATIPEARHLWLIEVKPAVTEGELKPTPAQVGEARTKANDALADIRSGTSFEDVAKSVSTDTATREQGGDLGWIESDDAFLDEALLAAAYELEANAVSDVLEGDDGVFRIVRVTDIEAEVVDALYQTKITNEGIDLGRYREVVRGQVIRDKLEAKIVADVGKPGLQRRVAQLLIATDEEGLVPEAVKVRHILYAPDDFIPGQDESPAPSDAPGWGPAEAEARAAYDRLTERPELFDRLARDESDEPIAQGTTGSGGKLGTYIAPDNTDFVPEFVEAISKPGLKDGDILEPVRTAFGWHVIQIMYHPPAKTQLEKLKAQAESGTDFGLLARDYSEDRVTAGAGGEIGWVALGELEKAAEEAVFGATVGKPSDIIELELSDGTYLALFMVFEEEERTPEGRQLDQLQANAFGEWYQEKKGALTIQRSLGEGF